jgi:hypothetical protein
MQSIFGVEALDGVDFAMDEGTEIMAADEGTVISAGTGLYGTTIILQHSWGRSYYGHLSETKVVAGDVVTTGMRIALSGNSGVTTGPHLHFGIRPNHYNPVNGYHGLIDPLPYLQGLVLGDSSPRSRVNFAHIFKSTLGAGESQVSVALSQHTDTLTFSLRNPVGESKLVHPTIYNSGTGEIALIERPSPFIPGMYILTITDGEGRYDEQTINWGVLTLNTDQSRYISGQSVKLSYAVLDEIGEMICDADMVLTITNPSGDTIDLTTDNAGIVRNVEVCKSKDVTLTPDYQSTFLPSEIGTYNLTLTAYTSKHTYTLSDAFRVEESLPYTLERITATRIFPGNIYPVILKLTAHTDLSSQLVETLSSSFITTPANESDLSRWLTGDELNIFDNTAYQRTEAGSVHTLSWDLSLSAGQSKIVAYTYDAPDESPSIYTIGPASYASSDELRAWQIAIDAADPVVGGFLPITNSWTDAANANLDLRQPSPENGDLMIASIAIRPAASTVDTPSGWTSQGSWSGTDGGAEALDAGSVSYYWFNKSPTAPKAYQSILRPAPVFGRAISPKSGVVPVPTISLLEVIV